MDAFKASLLLEEDIYIVMDVSIMDSPSPFPSANLVSIVERKGEESMLAKSEQLGFIKVSPSSFLLMASLASSICPSLSMSPSKASQIPRQPLDLRQPLLLYGFSKGKGK